MYLQFNQHFSESLGVPGMQRRRTRNRLRLGSALEGAGQQHRHCPTAGRVRRGPEHPALPDTFLGASEQSVLRALDFLTIPFNRCQLHGFFMKSGDEAVTLCDNAQRSVSR